MVLQRKDLRFSVKKEVVGVFNNDEKSLVTDFNSNGLHLAASFSPLIGSRYSLKLDQNGQIELFEIEVVRVNPGGYNMKEGSALPLGTVYSVGARILNINREKEKFLMKLLGN